MEGPKYETINVLDEYLRRTWYTQKPPFINPLPYTCLRVVVGTRWGSHIENAGNLRVLYDPFMQTDAEAYAQAYSRFRDKIGATAMWGENLAQHKETYQVAVGLLEACTHPTRKIAKILQGFSQRSFKGKSKPYKDRRTRTVVSRFTTRRNPSKVDPWVRPLKEMNAAYLEWVYGLKPLLSDLMATIEILDKPKDFSWDIDSTGTSFKEFSTRRSWMNHWSKFKCHMKLHGTITCTNPNVHRAEALGLTNPIALAYQLIPFSFIFDMLVDIGSYLSAFDDMYGLKMTGGYATTYNKGSFSSRYYDHDPDSSPFGTTGEAVWMQRQVTSSFASPKPYLKLNLSHWKAIHAASVLASVGLLRGR